MSPIDDVVLGVLIGCVAYYCGWHACRRQMAERELAARLLAAENMAVAKVLGDVRASQSEWMEPAS